MAQQQQNVTIAAPGFRGLNSQDSPITQTPEFAYIAENCVIDQYGRIGARKGTEAITTDTSALSSNPLSGIHEFLADDSSSTIISVGNNKIFKGDETLTDISPGSYTIAADDWDFANLNDECFLFQRGYEPLVYQASTGAIVKMTAHGSYSGTVQNANICLSAYGRLWVADITGDKHTIYWSDLLAGAAWSGGSSGSIDVSKFWPNGSDEIVDLAAHNGFLIIFGKRSILVYSGADGTPASDLALEDGIGGIGVVARDTIFSVGTDLWFTDVTGVRSLGRTIQEKSLPVGDISRNVRDELRTAINAETSGVICGYSQEEAFYLVGLVDSGIAYCFDSRNMLEDGSSRVTKWRPAVTGVARCFYRKDDGTFLVGGTGGVCHYSGYYDDGSDYKMSYYTHELTFGEPSRVKFPKQVDLTLIGGAGSTPKLLWSYDYAGIYKSKSFTLANADIGQYNVDEYEAAEFSASIVVDRTNTNVGGSGTALKLGVEVTVGSEISIQEINIQALLGRLR